MSSWYFNFGLLATQLAGAAIVLGLASIPILVFFACNSPFNSNPHWLPPFHQKAATCAILGIVLVVILLILQLIFPDVAGLSLSPTALYKRAEAPEAPQVHWSTYMWGTMTILFGLHTVWHQTVTYLMNQALQHKTRDWQGEHSRSYDLKHYHLNKEKWTAEKANLETEKANLEAEKAKLEAEKAKLEAEKAKLEAEKAKLEAEKAKLEAEKAVLEDNKNDVTVRLRRVEKEITRLHKVTLEDV